MGKLRDLYFKYIVNTITTGTHVANYRMRFLQKAEWLREKTLSSTASGISKELFCDAEVIVTLTTYGKRLYDVYLAIESIMQGSVKPNRIILWLSNDLRAITLPVTLKNQTKRGLQIEFCEDIKSYKKLVPSLEKYPDAIHITIDDDLIYEFDLVENLINSYKKTPHAIHAARVHRIKLNKNRLLPYTSWEWCKGTIHPSFKNFATGGGGILYPAHSLNKEVINRDLFMNMAPKADDVWFYAMAVSNGYKIKKIFTHSENGEDYLTNENVQHESLNSFNLANNGNDKQIEAVFKYYRIFDIIKKDNDV